MLWFSVRFGEKCALVWFFSHEFIRPNFLSSVVDCITKHNTEEGNLALSHERIGVRECNAEEARVNNELSCCWYRRERDRFLLSATFSEYSLLVERVSRRAIVHLFKRVEFFPSICVDRAVEREKKSQKSRGRTHRQKGRLKFFFFKLVLLIFSLSLSPV